METNTRVTKTFKGTKALPDFCLWLFQTNHEGAIAIAHNSKGLSFIILLFITLLFAGYDGQFVMQWIRKQAREPNTIERGLEILSLEYNGVKMIDSLSYLTMPLSAFPKTLGFDAAKGYFPHLFNTEENWNAVQQGLPDAWLVFSHHYMFISQLNDYLQVLLTCVDETRGS